MDPRRLGSRRLTTLLGAAVLALSTGILAQSAQNKAVDGAAPTQPGDDADFARSVKAWTTRPDFVSPLVDHLPKVEGVPSPKDVLGHHIGEPKKLTYYADILGYYRALAAKTPRVKVTTIGRSNEGRDLVVVFIGSDESIQNLEQYRGYLGQLADPRTLSPAEAKDVIAKAKPIYHLMGGLHSAEVGPSEMLMELAYRLATEDSPIVKAIRDNVIVSITPAADPDGRDRNVDWYYHYGINETEGHPTGAFVPYWGKYVFHDDNRDINYSQVEMRSLLDWYLQWHPPIMHDLHQAQTLLYTFSGQAPQNPNLDPILYGELPMMANFEMAQMAKYGMPGVWTHGFVDMWSPGYLAFMSSNHNGMIRMYEIQGTSGANTTKLHLGGTPPNGRAATEAETPADSRPAAATGSQTPAAAGAGRGEGRGEGRGSGSGRGAADARGAAAGRGTSAGRGRGVPQSQREWYRPWPATGEFEWSIRDNTNYGETGVLTALQYTSQFAKVILENFYVKSRNSIDTGRKEAVAGYVIPSGQRDMTRVERVVNLLRMQGIEIGRADAEVKLADGTFPAGSFIVKRDQPYARLAKTLLEKQVYPDPSLRTYDDAAWTMGLMSQVDVKEIDDKKILDVAVAPVKEKEIHLAGTVRGAGSIVAVADYGSNNMITLRYRLKDLKVQAAEKEFKQGDTVFPAGSFVVTGDAGRVKEAVQALGLTGAALASAPDVPMHDVDLPRLAIYSTWGSTQDVGWVRYAFDRFGVPYDLIYKERARQGDLRAAYDVIIVPNQAGSAKRLVFDVEGRGKPIEYRRSEPFKNLGMYGESADITGGMGLEGVAEFEKFVKAGGVLVTLGAASYFPAEFGLAPGVDAARPSAQFYAPGPIVDAEILHPEHPIFYGYNRTMVPVRYASGPLLTVQTDRDPFEQSAEPPPTPESVLMRYPGGDDHVLSGLMRGANEIRNHPAIVDQPNGKGRVILFAGNPCYRWQNFGEFNMLFNTVMHFNDLGAGEAAKPATAGRP
ncbi:MAG TPA: M14 family zinc carboxypeptidase [Vicinamibacterales bacterium]|nr:M14 family zinc carboxypeptidase [Vicinamibacterales bacterium]